MNVASWKSQFIYLLSQQKITVEHIFEAFRIKNLNLPKSVYKYRKVDQFSLTNLESDHVWCSPPDQYNDPYDTALTFSPEVLRSHITRANFYKYVETLGLKNIASDDELKRAEISLDPLLSLFALFADKMEKKNPSVELLKKSIQAHMETQNRELVLSLTTSLQQNMGVCSFSEEKESVVMWGHYAEKHTGFCIEYDIESLPKEDIRRRWLYPVVYSEKLFDATKYLLAAHQNKNDFNNLFGVLSAIYKSKDWEYEKEWRLIQPIGDVVQKYPMSKPKNIFLGSRISSANKDKITKIGKRKGVPVIQMEISESEYKMIPARALT